MSVRRFALYLLRWQASTPILALVLATLPLGVVGNAIIANLIGGILFFWIDRWIFLR